jgi:hypothetical protein
MGCTALALRVQLMACFEKTATAQEWLRLLKDLQASQHAPVLLAFTTARFRSK